MITLCFHCTNLTLTDLLKLIVFEGYFISYNPHWQDDNNTGGTQIAFSCYKLFSQVSELSQILTSLHNKMERTIIDHLTSESVG